MKHLATIQNEFLVIAGDLATHDTWDSWSYEQQKKYLERHPGSEKKITAKPDASAYYKKFPQMKVDPEMTGLLHKLNEHIEEKKMQLGAK